MKRVLFVLIGLIVLSVNLSALQGEIVYVEGSVDLKQAQGAIDWADIGMAVETGDSIITGSDGYAEIEMEDGSTVKISEDSIFALASYDSDGKSQNTFQCVLGSVQYKFTQTVKDNEPRISTPSTICGIRGTEFTVLSGLDGSALYVVDEGSVAVSAQGEEVLLGALEGVRIEAGEAPGEVFPVLRGKVDYSQIQKEAEQRFLEAPSGAMRVMTSQLQAYIKEMQFYEEEFQKLYATILELREELFQLEGEAAQQFYANNLSKIEVESSYLKLNVRYYAVSSLSLRRYLVGTMYVNIRTKYILNPENPEYLGFMKEYDQFLNLFETELVPFLVIADI